MPDLPDNDDDILSSVQKDKSKETSSEEEISAFARCNLCGGMGHVEGFCPPTVSATA